MRCAIYARVSSDDQSVSMQLSELRDYIRLRKWEPCGEYIDEGVSGAVRDRVQLNALMEQVRRGKLDIVLVWRFDRAARSVTHMLQILEDLQRHNVEFCSMNENIDSSTPHGKLLFTIVAAFAEFEKRIIQERTRAGIAEARRQGKRIGRPRAKEFTASEIRERLETEGSISKAAKALDVPLSTLRNRMRELGIERHKEVVACEETSLSVSTLEVSSSTPKAETA